jgi:hypothetical protein
MSPPDVLLDMNNAIAAAQTATVEYIALPTPKANDLAGRKLLEEMVKNAIDRGLNNWGREAAYAELWG